MASLRQQMRQDMFNSMRELLGTGYVKSYYIECMADFVQIADWYAQEKTKAELQEKLRQQREACIAKIKEYKLNKSDELTPYANGVIETVNYVLNDIEKAIRSATIDNNGEEG